jgi:hypothetical protein
MEAAAGGDRAPEIIPPAVPAAPSPSPSPSPAPSAARRFILVLDTSVFTNPDIRSAFGPTPTDALRTFLGFARRLTPTLEFYMPPSIYVELSHFVTLADVPPDVELLIQRRPPNKYALDVPSFLLYELIEDVRRRVDKGLRVAEEAARATPAERGEQEHITTLRRKYREALREGIIDSTEDVELILLARELDAIVVSADKGVVTWAEKLGLRSIDPARLHALLEQLAARAG